MLYTIELTARLSKQIEEFCKINEITLTDYLHNLIEKGFAIDMYGDLNHTDNKQEENKSFSIEDFKNLYEEGVYDKDKNAIVFKSKKGIDSIVVTMPIMVDSQKDFEPISDTYIAVNTLEKVKENKTKRTLKSK